MINTDVWEILNNLSAAIFNIELHKLNRNIYVFKYKVNDSQHQSHITEFKQIFGLENDILTKYFKKNHVMFNKKAAVSYDFGIKIKELNFNNTDVFFFSDIVLESYEIKRYGTFNHELCHYFLDGNFKLPFELDEISYTQGKKLRNLTRFKDNDKVHSNKWFALLFKSSFFLHKLYPLMYKDHNIAVYNSIFYDILPEYKNNNHKILLEDIKWLS